MDTVRWGIIGCGNVTEVKSGPGFQKAEHSALVAVMRRNGKLAQDYAERHQVPKWYDNANELIHDPEVDAIYIATPPSTHLVYTLAAAKAGKPVYVEKPLAINYQECEQMIQACEKAGVPFYAAYYRRALPRFQKVKELLGCGAIGEIYTVTTTHLQKPSQVDYNKAQLPWRLQPEISGGGYFFDLASHTLDLLDYLLGPITEVDGRSSNVGGLYSAEDTVSGSYLFETGVHGIGIWNFVSNTQVDANVITGSQGQLSFSTFGNEPIRLNSNAGSEEFAIPHPDHIQQPLIQSIVDELRGQGTCPSTGQTAARTSRVMDAMVRK